MAREELIVAPGAPPPAPRASSTAVTRIAVKRWWKRRTPISGSSGPTRPRQRVIESCESLGSAGNERSNVGSGMLSTCAYTRR